MSTPIVIYGERSFFLYEGTKRQLLDAGLALGEMFPKRGEPEKKGKAHGTYWRVRMVSNFRYQVIRGVP